MSSESVEKIPALDGPPVIGPGYTYASVSDKISAIVLTRKTPRAWFIGFGISFIMTILRLIDLFWMVEPTQRPNLQVYWLDLVTPIGMGGIWIAIFIWQLKGRPLLPLNDPQLQVVMKHE